MGYNYGMSEEKGGPDWGLLKKKVDNIRIRARFALDRAVDQAKYHAVVSGERHKEASRLAEAFGGEALTFLEDNLTAKLSPLHPTKAQVRIFQYLMDSAEDGSLKLKSTGGKLYTGGRPFVIKHYEVGDRFEATGDLADRLA